MAHNLKLCNRVFQNLVQNHVQKSVQSSVRHTLHYSKSSISLSKFDSGTLKKSDTILDDTTAYDLIVNLDEKERTVLKAALSKLESNVIKQKLEGKIRILFSINWFSH